MKKLNELSGVKVKAKIRGEYVDCVLSVVDWGGDACDGSLFFCQDKIKGHWSGYSDINHYGKKFVCNMMDIDEVADEELGIFVYKNAGAQKSDIKEANFIHLSNSKIDFHKLKVIRGHLFCGDMENITFPKLTIIGEGFYASDVNTLSLPKLKAAAFLANNVTLILPEAKSIDCAGGDNVNILGPEPQRHT